MSSENDKSNSSDISAESISERLAAIELTLSQKRESKSRPDEGIVTVKTIGKNQDSVEVASFIRSALIPKEGKAVEDKIDY